MKVQISGVIAALIMLMVSAAARGKEPPPCPRDQMKVVRSAVADFSYCIKGGGCEGLGHRVFRNKPSVLPGTSSGEEFWEARVGTDRAGRGGVYRLVFRVGGRFGTAGARINAKYFTDDHYTKGSFCTL